jgi:hypothetical protein
MTTLLLTPEQALIVDKATEPVKAKDAQTQREYVIVSQDTWNRVRRILELDVTDRSFYECSEPVRHS